MKIISFEELREKLGGDKAPHRATIDRMIARGEFVQLYGQPTLTTASNIIALY